MSDIVGVPRDAVVVHPPLSFDAGDDWPINFEVNDSDGNPIDLTTAIALEWTLTDLLGATVLVKTLADVTVDPDQTNHGVLLIARDETATVPAGIYFDAMILEPADAIRQHQFRGRITVLA